MSLIFEINHPAHIHLFRTLALELLQKGENPLFTIKSDPVTHHLAEVYDLPAGALGSKGKGILQKYVFQLRFFWKTLRLVRQGKIKLGMGVSMNLPLVSKWSSMHSICLDDDDMAATPTFARYANKANVILTPEALAFEDRGAHHFSYPGYHELAYLHPKRFVPEEKVLRMIGVEYGERYFVVRLNAFRAHHDVGESGMGDEQRETVIKKLRPFGRVFLSMEKTLRQAQGDRGIRGHAEPVEAWQETGAEFLNDLIGPEWMHSVLAFATMYVGESQTMTSEAAVLGTPALKCNSFAGRLSVPNELEQKYGLCYSYLPGDFDKMLAKMDELLEMPDLKQEWQLRRQRMLQDKIDVTGFLAWFVEHYPESVSIVKREGDALFSRWK